ncbi:hydantoinase B/oxoprolinase family protein [Cryobacterium glaciale]|uniref:Hydantoinase B/oxoprolinase family protein n=1 Tax=Cryobacterium glaciale TaxID=1259145 RepID=A0A4R8V0A4_9MICO|nr:hydantoinase B/oxoprolinase family protein [Cryobacterium glaciale]TFB75011.1 hydantoinase B/oxoprolinase family protein [Cryobacterium glaciale]
MSSLVLDPITFEVIKHRLWQINDEQGIAIRSISTSTIVVEGNDFNVGLFAANGDLAVAGPYVTSHVTTMDALIKNVIETAGDDVEDGDIFLCNDPYMGALHQNDVAVVSPIFVDGQILLWAGNVVHHADLAGIDEGSFCVNATSVFQEAPRYFLKVVRAGVLCRDVERTFITNSRTPEMVAMDLRAQIGAINVAVKRVRELSDTYGAGVVRDVMTQTIAYSGELLRERIGELPDGTWSTEVFMDGDRVGSDEILTVKLTLTKSGETLHFDYAGSSPQSAGAVNATDYSTYAGTTTPVYAFLCGSEIDWNSSIRKSVTVDAPSGSVVNANYPAAVSICSIGFTWLTAVAATRVIAAMLSESEKYRNRACASWGVACCGNNVFSQGSDGELIGGLLSDHRGAGAGARANQDGIDHAGTVFSPLSYMSNVESQELKFPFLYLFRKRLVDSGGPGRFRGGMTILAAMTPFGTESVTWKSQNTAGSDQSNAAGLEGGYPGAGSQVSVVRNTDVWQTLSQHPTGTDIGAFGGEVIHLETKSEGVLRRGDVFVFHPPGGGGFGDPLDRDPEDVAADVRDGVISLEAAVHNYAVGLSTDGSVDYVETAEQRNARRQISATQPDTSEALRSTSGTPTPTKCPRCGRATEIGKPTRWTSPLSAAGPWLAERWQGNSPNFKLLHTSCTACGSEWDVCEVAAPDDTSPLPAFSKGA